MALRGGSGRPPPPKDFSGGGIGRGGLVPTPYWRHWLINANKIREQKRRLNLDTYKSRTTIDSWHHCQISQQEATTSLNTITPLLHPTCTVMPDQNEWQCSKRRATWSCAEGIWPKTSHTSDQMSCDAVTTTSNPAHNKVDARGLWATYLWYDCASTKQKTSGRPALSNMKKLQIRILDEQDPRILVHRPPTRVAELPSA